MQLQEEKVFNYFKDFIFQDEDNLALFPSHNKKTIVETIKVKGVPVHRFINEYWTSRQRQASSIHEIAYRACFKAELPRFFMQLLTEPGDTVYDPFSGRGTTVIEGGLLQRRVIANDINPLSRIMTSPRLAVPEEEEIKARLEAIPVDRALKADLDLSMFYHPRTEGEIVSLKQYLEGKKARGEEDEVDSWIRMVATNRLTGHSPGFFSVYTLPPNQAVSPERQLKINQKRNQQPEYRDVKKIIARKTSSLCRNISLTELGKLREAAKTAMFLQKDAGDTPEIADNSVHLTVTSPPFLDVVQYSRDNWLRCWFNGINAVEIEKQLTMSRTLEEWSTVMGRVFHELFRLTRPGGWVAFEVGEVKNGKISLEEYVLPLGLEAGFKCAGVVINLQKFTKTSNIWGVKNNHLGTNTNRIALFYKA